MPFVTERKTNENKLLRTFSKLTISLPLYVAVRVFRIIFYRFFVYGGCEGYIRFWYVKVGILPNNWNQPAVEMNFITPKRLE